MAQCGGISSGPLQTQLCSLLRIIMYCIRGRGWVLLMLLLIACLVPCLFVDVSWDEVQSTAVITEEYIIKC